MATKSKDCSDCDDHGAYFGQGRKHPDRMHNPGRGYDPETKRGAAHPAHHTPGKMPSQLNPNHGKFR